MPAYYYCVVPRCESSTYKNPEKRFFALPKDLKRRNAWLRAIRRYPTDLSKSSNKYVCEDHFDLKNDLENYMLYKFNPKTKCQFKKGIVPHKFDCQKEIKACSSKDREFSKKREKRKDAHTIIDPLLQEEVAGPSQIENMEFEDNVQYEAALTMLSFSQKEVKLPPKKYNIGIQCALRPSYRSKGTFCNLVPVLSTSNVPQSNDAFDSSSPEAELSPATPSSSWSGSKEEKSKHKTARINYYNIFKKNIRKYIGIPSDCYKIIGNLETLLNCSEKSIFLTLLKIRRAYAIDDIADFFEISKSQASRIFSKTVVPLSMILQQLIYWPDQEKIYANLPIPFRANYSKVQSIIDCFKVQIEQPSDPVLQTLTWSYYKNCNTMKYLVSATPDGLITFVSKGFGGRISDKEIVKESNFLEILPEGSWVMADRGFKGLAVELHRKGCRLVRPPSVSAGEKLTREEVLASKRIASLRINIERVIRRLREFSILKSHSTINHKLIKFLDNIVIIAAGLCNIQNPIVKTE